MPPCPIVGVVVCGGASRRMGTDKALLDWNGRALVSIPAAALRAGGCGEVLAVTRPGHISEPMYAELGLDGVIIDEWPGEGPMGALITAMRARPLANLVVLPCDLPFVTAGVVEQLVQTPGEAVVADDGAIQPFVARFGQDCREALEEQWLMGERSLRRALRVVRHATLNVQSGVLADVDTPEKARELRSEAD